MTGDTPDTPEEKVAAFWTAFRAAQALMEPKPDDIVALICHPLDVEQLSMSSQLHADPRARRDQMSGRLFGLPVEVDDWLPRGQHYVVLHKQKKLYDHYRAKGYAAARALLVASIEVPADG